MEINNADLSAMLEPRDVSTSSPSRTPASASARKTAPALLQSSARQRPNTDLIDSSIDEGKEDTSPALMQQQQPRSSLQSTTLSTPRPEGQGTPRDDLLVSSAIGLRAR
eukprot:3594156-Rhodomonas_salina.3